LNEKKDIQGYSANIQGVENLIKAIQQCGSVRRCIYISTQLVCQIGYIPQSDVDYKPNTIYGLSKVKTEQIVRSHSGGGVEWCIVRPTTIWGPWFSPHYQNFLKFIRSGKYFHVGNKNYMKSYGYVGNFCYQLLALIDAPYEQIRERVFYVADYTPISLRQWTEAFRKGLNAPPIKTYPIQLAKITAIIGDGIVRLGYKQFPFTSFRLNNILTEYVYDLSETQKVIPKLPYSMDEGIKETVDWYKIIIMK
jgi:GlcNAc-P-P-Und epimerase